MFDRFADEDYVAWAKQVKERDNYVCQVCGIYGVSLNSHHLYSWALFEKLRYDIDNGVTLCSECHERFHQIYGKGINTLAQFNEYRETIKLITKIAKNI